MNWLKTAGITALAFVAYRGYKLWELANSFSYRFTGLYFVKPKNLKELLDKFQIVTEYTIMNPTSTSLAVNGAFGGISYNGELIGTFKVPAFTIQSAETKIKATILISSAMAARIVGDITKKKFPVFDVTLNTIMPFGYLNKQTFKIDSKDYIPQGVLNIFI